jgi:hypothetical protein
LLSAAFLAGFGVAFFVFGSVVFLVGARAFFLSADVVISTISSSSSGALFVSCESSIIVGFSAGASVRFYKFVSLECMQVPFSWEVQHLTLPLHQNLLLLVFCLAVC